MDNLYGQYLVTRAEVIKYPVEDDKELEIYRVELCGEDNHCLGFELVLKNMFGVDNSDQKKIFECISPHIQKNQLLHIEFAFRFYQGSQSHLNLCMVRFIKSQCRRWSDGVVMNPRDFFDSNRGYLVTAWPYEEWIYPSHGLIELSGESVIPIDLSSGQPRLYKHSEINSSDYVLSWQKRIVQKLSGVRLVLAKLFR